MAIHERNSTAAANPNVHGQGRRGDGYGRQDSRDLYVGDYCTARTIWFRHAAIARCAHAILDWGSRERVNRGAWLARVVSSGGSPFAVVSVDGGDTYWHQPGISVSPVRTPARWCWPSCCRCCPNRDWTRLKRLGTGAARSMGTVAGLVEFASARIPGNLLLTAYAGLAKEKTMAGVAVVVTGAGGLIARHLVRALLDEGRSVRAVISSYSTSGFGSLRSWEWHEPCHSPGRCARHRH